MSFLFNALLIACERGVSLLFDSAHVSTNMQLLETEGRERFKGSASLEEKDLQLDTALI